MRPGWRGRPILSGVLDVEMICDKGDGRALPSGHSPGRFIKIGVTLAFAGAASLMKPEDLPRKRIGDAIQSKAGFLPSFDAHRTVVNLMNYVHVPCITGFFVVHVSHASNLSREHPGLSGGGRTRGSSGRFLLVDPRRLHTG